MSPGVHRLEAFNVVMFLSLVLLFAVWGKIMNDRFTALESRPPCTCEEKP